MKTLKRIYNSLTEHQKEKVKKIYWRVMSRFYSNNLDKLALINGSDKFGTHFYTQHYHNHFKKFKNKKIKILEIGVGGHMNPLLGGGSLRMWKYYFTKGTIFGFDIYDKTKLQERRIKIFKGSQIDKVFLADMLTQTGELDIIIDDGSHINEHVIESFKVLFPYIKNGGYYVIEDVQTTYWQNFGGDSKNLENRNTIMGFFKALTDCVNYQEIITDKFNPSYYDKNIAAIFFYHNLIFIKKEQTNELSNVVKGGKIASEIYIEK